MLGRSKALFGVLSAIAIVAPASGLAYLGVKSNLAERERARQSFFALNQKEARFLAAALDDEAAGALDALEPPAKVEGPLVEMVFELDGAGRVEWPQPPGAATRRAARPAEPERSETGG